MASEVENPADTQEESTQYLAGVRQESPAIRKITLALGALIAVIPIAWSIDLPLMLGFEWFKEQGLAAALGLTFAVIFIRVPFRGRAPRLRVPWYDAIFAALGAGACFYLTYRYEDLVNDFFALRREAFIISLVILPLVWEALRRTAGTSLTVIFSVFMVYGFIGHLMPGRLEGKEQKVESFVAYLGVDNVALFGLPMIIVTMIVVLFIWIGRLLLSSGASEWFTELAAAVMGRSRGGSAKIAIVASGLFGSISGSAVSNVMSTGVLTIPLMRQGGYNAKSAGAIEAVASTGGQIMPPIMGAAAFLIAEFLEVGYTEVVLAALAPALLYYIAVFVQADLEAAKTGIAPLPEERIPPLLRVIKEGWHFTIPFIVLIYTLFEMNMPPEASAFWAAVSVMFIAFILPYKGKRLGLTKMWDAVADAGRSAVDVIMIGAMAGLIIGILEKTGLGFALTLILSEFGEGNLGLMLLLTAGISILLGMGMPTTAIYLLLATMIAPSLIKLGVQPMAAHLFVLYFGLMSMITPPVAIAAFVASTLAGSKPMETAATAVRLGWIAYVVPFVFVLSPSLIGYGSTLSVATAFVTAVIGVWIASCGLMGYLFQPLNALLRLLFFAAGIALLIPGDAFSEGVTINIAGAVVAVLLVGRELLVRRNGRAPRQAEGAAGE